MCLLLIKINNTMKYSIFNSLLTVGKSKYLLYNSLADVYLILNHHQYDIIRLHDNSTITDLDNLFYDQLVAAGVIINDNENEAAKIRQISDQEIMNDSICLLTVNPTINCNFNCWYCYETHDVTSKMNDNTLERTQKFIINKLNNDNLKVFNLSFFGGEPLLYFKSVVMPLMLYLKNIHNDKVRKSYSFTSNAYLISDEIIDFLKQFENLSFQITLDGDREKHNSVRFPAKGIGSYDVILANAAKLLAIGAEVILRINYTIENIDSVHSIKSDVEHYVGLELREKLIFSFHRVWQDECKGDISEKINDIIRLLSKDGFNVNGRPLDNVRKPCYADIKNGAVVNYNGDVFKCSARDFMTVKRDGYLGENGEIVWENDALNKRLDVKFKNKPCLECRILPLCGGGCSQKALEYQAKGEEYCICGHSEEQKDKIVLDRFYNQFVVNKPAEV